MPVSRRNDPAPSDVRHVANDDAARAAFEKIKRHYGHVRAVSKYRSKYLAAKRHIGWLRDPSCHAIEITEFAFEKLLAKAVELFGTNAAKALSWTLKSYADGLFTFLKLLDATSRVQNELRNLSRVRAETLKKVDDTLDRYDRRGSYMRDYHWESERMIGVLAIARAYVTIENYEADPNIVWSALRDGSRKAVRLDALEGHIDELFGAWVMLEHTRMLSVMAIDRYNRFYARLEARPTRGIIGRAIENELTLLSVEQGYDAHAPSERLWTSPIDDMIARTKMAIAFWLKEEAAFEQKVADLRIFERLLEVGAQVEARRSSGMAQVVPRGDR